MSEIRGGPRSWEEWDRAAWDRIGRYVADAGGPGVTPAERERLRQGLGEDMLTLFLRAAMLARQSGGFSRYWQSVMAVSEHLDEIVRPGLYLRGAPR